MLWFLSRLKSRNSFFYLYRFNDCDSMGGAMIRPYLTRSFKFSIPALSRVMQQDKWLHITFPTTSEKFRPVLFLVKENLDLSGKETGSVKTSLKYCVKIFVCDEHQIAGRDTQPFDKIDKLIK